MNSAIENNRHTYKIISEQLDKVNSIVRREYNLTTNGKALYAREIFPAVQSSGKYVIFVHGLTFPSSVDFDLPRKGYSVTEYLSSKGINCCIFDIRGYGKSYKPAYGEPLGMAERAQDLSTVYHFIKRKYSTDNISLVGLSNGCNTITEFLGTTKETPCSLVFIGPSYILNTAMIMVLKRSKFIRFLQSLIGRKDNVYAPIGIGLLRSRLYRGEEMLIDRDTFELFVTKSIEISSPNSKALRAPVISFPDLDRSWRKWDTLFDAGKITCPLLIMRGDRDEFCCKRTAETLAENVSTKQVTLLTFKDRKHDLHLYMKHLDYFEEIFNFLAKHGKNAIKDQ